MQTTGFRVCAAEDQVGGPVAFPCSASGVLLRRRAFSHHLNTFPVVSTTTHTQKEDRCVDNATSSEIITRTKENNSSNASPRAVLRFIGFPPSAIERP